MMQIFIHILIFLNPILQTDLDTTKLKSFSIKGEKYWFGGFNEVYQKINDSLVQIDVSLDYIKTSVIA